MVVEGFTGSSRHRKRRQGTMSRVALTSDPACSMLSHSSLTFTQRTPTARRSQQIVGPLFCGPAASFRYKERAALVSRDPLLSRTPLCVNGKILTIPPDSPLFFEGFRGECLGLWATRQQKRKPHHCAYILPAAYPRRRLF